jgi:ribosomal protein L13
MMGRFRELTGGRFGRLVALHATDQRRGGNVVWHCVCDCGAEVDVDGSNLRHHRTRSCGCLQRERASEARFVDRTGQRYGRLVALQATDQRRGGNVVWRCACDCGRVTFVRNNNLVSGRTRSCGCSSVIDLTGQRFGRLTALRATDERRGGQVVWHCRCDCGREVGVITCSLRGGHTRSCGCLRGERV